MKSAFFGGSFDPPHAGHLAVARGALDSGKCDFVRWVVGRTPPHKLAAKRAPFPDRLAMVELLIGNEKAMAVSDLEAHLPQEVPTYTIDALALYETLYGERPALLIGADSLLELHTWREAYRLVCEYEILTYQRPGCRVSEMTLSANWGDREVEKLLSGVLPGELWNMSSTQIRKDVKAKCAEKDENAAVRDYIAAHRLYR